MQFQSLHEEYIQCRRRGSNTLLTMQASSSANKSATSSLNPKTLNFDYHCNVGEIQNLREGFTFNARSEGSNIPVSVILTLQAITLARAISPKTPIFTILAMSVKFKVSTRSLMSFFFVFFNCRRRGWVMSKSRAELTWY